ncbi:MAG: Uma2 family endonuclease [Armatimonadota bacterium]|nr:Uma2 family endonuclease [bacterium]MDW8321374.1 Uma2 family endonuclease [Armatimonadota bacterium]
MVTVRAKPEVQYPESDGRPMAESPEHLHVMLSLIATLQAYFATRQDVYVGGNQFLYWIEGNPRQRVALDVYVVFGVPRRPWRATWKVWEMGKAPDVIIELTSPSTASEDLGRKYQLYQRLRVEEYLLIDVKHEYLKEPLNLYRLMEGEYQRVPNQRTPSEEWRAHSELLGLTLVLTPGETGYQVRLWEPQGDRWLLNPLEVAEQYELAQQQLLDMKRRFAQEAQTRARLEERVRELEEELRRLKEGSR